LFSQSRFEYVEKESRKRAKTRSFDGVLRLLIFSPSKYPNGAHTDALLLGRRGLSRIEHVDGYLHFASGGLGPVPKFGPVGVQSAIEDVDNRETYDDADDDVDGIFVVRLPAPPEAVVTATSRHSQPIRTE